MFSRSAIQAGRTTKAHTAALPVFGSVNLNPIAAAASTRVRRHSSSKASCPPGGSQPTAPTPEAVRPSSRLSRRRTKDAAEFSTSKTRNGAFADLPSVPMTDNVAPEAVTMASFFSLHRPISLIHPIPQTYTMENFNSIFSSGTPQRKSADVIQTLSSAVSVLEGGRRSAEEQEMRWEVQQSKTSRASGHGASMLNMEQLVKQFRPFNVPPPPMPYDMAAEAISKKETKQSRRTAQEAEAKQEASHKTYQTTVTINEATSSNGKKTFTASATPIVERRVPPRIAHQPFLRRMAQRQQQQQIIEEPVEGFEDGEQEGMMLISVKRQRKLKMKKHKYKKLMKRTRNLRRKLGKT